MKKKIITVALAAAAAAAAIAMIVLACSPVTVEIVLPQTGARQTAPQETEAPQTDPIPAETPAETGTAPAETAQPETTAPAAAAPETTAPAATAPAATEPPQTQPAAAEPAAAAMTKEEIVALYNTAVNRVKKEASTLTRNYKHTSVPEDQLELPGAIQGLGKSAIGMFVKGTDTPESWTDKADMEIVFPVGNTDYSSHLTADMVETAACEETGGVYKIRLKLYDDKITSPEKGQGYAGVFNTVTASTITGINIPAVTFNRVDVNGVDGSITCTVEKASGRVTEITFANTDILDLEVKAVLSTLNAKLALVSEENFTVEY